MNPIVASVRRRFSSNASNGVVTVEPPSPDADGRRPTLITTPMHVRSNSMGDPLISSSTGLPTPPISRHSTEVSMVASEYTLAPEYIDPNQQLEEYRPFPTMGDILAEDSGFYPLERQPHRGHVDYIEDVGGYTGPIIYQHNSITTTVTEINLPTRRPSAFQQMRGSVSKVGYHARKISGDLGRKASKMVKMNMAPNLIRKKQRDGFDLEAEWQVDLGREVQDDSPLWPQSIEQDFRVVQWQAEAAI